MFTNCRKPNKRNEVPDTTVIARQKVPNDWSFKGLIVITIDYLESPEEGRPNCIRFSGKTHGCEDANTKAHEHKAGVKNQNHNETLKDAATFICNCEYDSTVGQNSEGERVFKADKLTIREAKTWFVREYGKDCVPFFWVHGYDNEPLGVMTTAQIAQTTLNSSEKKCKIVPVLWPSYGLTRYDIDLDYAKEASKELRLIFGLGVGVANVFEKKNLMCHSMGNFILRNAADSRIKFDNIFMVAADVNVNIFGNKYISKFNTTSDIRYHDGLRIVQMLKEGGKIYCIWNFEDWALSDGSSRYNGEYRLGMSGIGSTCHKNYYLGIPGWLYIKPLDGGLHKDFEGRYENIEMQYADEFPGHSYHWNQETIGYYREKLGLN